MLNLDINQEEDSPEMREFEGLLDSLLTVLNKEVEVYRELQMITDDSREALKQPSLELLSENHNKMETSILKVRMLEDARGKIVRKMAANLDIEERDINLTLLCCHARGKRKMELQSLQKALSQIIRSLKEANDQSKDMLAYSLFYVQSTMNFISTILSAGADYGNTGHLKAGALNGKILSKKG